MRALTQRFNQAAGQPRRRGRLPGFLAGLAAGAALTIGATLVPGEAAETGPGDGRCVSLDVPTDQPVSATAMFRGFGFDASGMAEKAAGIATLGLPAWIAWQDAMAAKAEVAARFPGQPIMYNDVDAFRHALWGYKMASHLPAGLARLYGNAREAGSDDPDGAVLQDLFNNRAGRHLAADPANRGRPAAEVILEALKAGRLQTRPFTLADMKHPPAPLCQPITIKRPQ